MRAACGSWSSAPPLAGVVALGAVLLGGLPGCAASSSPPAGTVSVTYDQDGVETDVEIAVADLDCVKTGGTVSAHSTEERGEDPWMFTVSGKKGAYAVLVQLDDQHWFLGDRTGVSVDDAGVELDGASGSVVLGADASGGVIDSDASATGTLSCTER